jgi:sulfite reductase beta subunit-like hemoprotein
LRTGLAVYAGGKHGRASRIADHVADLLPAEEVASVVEAALAWYREHGRRGQRLAHVIEEQGVERCKEAAIPAAYRVAAGRQRQTGGLVR